MRRRISFLENETLRSAERDSLASHLNFTRLSSCLSNLGIVLYLIH